MGKLSSPNCEICGSVDVQHQLSERKEMVGMCRTTENRLIEGIASIREDVNEALVRGIGEGNGYDLDMEKGKRYTTMVDLLKFIELEIRQVKRAVVEMPSLSGIEGVEEEVDDEQTGTLIQKVKRMHRILGKEKTSDNGCRDDLVEGEDHRHRIMGKLEEIREKEDENGKRLVDIGESQKKMENRIASLNSGFLGLERGRNKAEVEMERIKEDQKETRKESVEKLEAISEKEDKIMREMGEMRASYEEMMEKTAKKVEMINDKKDRIERGVDDIRLGQNEMRDESMKKLEVISEKEDRIVEEIERMKVSHEDMRSRGNEAVRDHELSGAIARIRNDVVELKDKLTPTYAEVLVRHSGGKSQAARGPPIGKKFSVIVSSTEVMDTAGDIEEKVKTILEPRKKKIRLLAVRKVKDCKVLLTCASQEEIERVECLLKGKNDVVVERAKKKDPLVLLKNLQNYNTEEDIIESLRGQNAEMWTDLAEGEFRVSERYRRRARNQKESMVVLQVSPEMWTRMTSVGKVHIDMQHVNVCDQSPLVQCTKCLRYGHGRKQCKEEADCCGHCGGPHLRADCPQYDAGTAPQCRNCGEGTGQQDAAHNALSGDCPTRVKWDALARARYEYCV